MRGKTFRGAWLLAAWLALVGGGRGQGPSSTGSTASMPASNALLPTGVSGQPPGNGFAPGIPPLPASSSSSGPYTAGYTPTSGSVPAPGYSSAPVVSPLPASTGSPGPYNSNYTAALTPDYTLAPSCVRGQEPGNSYAPADPQAPLPIGSTRPEDGGLYFAAEFMFFHQTNPLQQQNVAVRGFQVSDNSVSGVLPGNFVGSHAPALDVSQLTGQDSYQPGFRLTAGWKFGDNSALTFSYFFLTEADYRAGATLAPPGGQTGQDLANTFLFAPVFNFPPEYAGPDNKIVIPGTTFGSTAQAAYGIWNGASIMTLNYIQRFQEMEITYRQTICETEDSRLTGLVGPRFDWIWETFQWRSTSYGEVSPGIIAAGPQSTAIYSDLSSNRMYGVHTGIQYECYLGHGFAFMCEAQGALLMDFIDEKANYYLSDKFEGLPESKQAKRIWNVVPEIQGNIGMMWYPWEFVQIQVGYQLMAFYNTIDARQPVSFNYANPSPHYDTTYRVFDGFMAGVSITF